MLKKRIYTDICLINRQIVALSVVLIGSVPMMSMAETTATPPTDNNQSQTQNQNKDNAQPATDITDTSVATAPIKNDATKVLNKEESIVYLKEHPQEMEATLSHLIREQDADNLKDLLPLYAQYPQRDDSVIDWGNAIVALKEGRIEDSIKLYRKVNAILPNIKLLRFQLAYALYQNKQYKAAKDELEKLRSSLTDPNDIKAINTYINAIDNQEKWSFNFGLNFLNDNNLTNAPPVGTKLNDTWSFTRPHEKGTGIGYSMGADKKWSIDDKYFMSAHLNGYGNYYWDNHKFSDANANIGAGLGYQNAMTEVEVYPSFTQRWYGGGNSRKTDVGDLKRYSQTKAMNLSLSHWFNPKLMYQNFSQFGTIRYEGDSKVNNLNTTLLANTVMYLPKQTRSFFGGIDYLKGNNTEGYDGDSYDRVGLRLGWSEAWNHGLSTRMTLGYGQRNYDAPQDFLGIKRKNKDYDVDLSFWKRDFTLFKLTPRISWNYHKVTSNSAFEEYSKNNINLELTQTF